jgi:hypothetical protein
LAVPLRRIPKNFTLLGYWLDETADEATDTTGTPEKG